MKNKKVIALLIIVMISFWFSPLKATEHEITIPDSANFGVELQPEQSILWKPFPSDPNSPGGFLGSSTMAAEKVETLGETPNLAITSIQIVNSSGNPITPVAGKKFWVRVNFTYVNPTCTYYTIRRAVNGWTHTAPAINWGCGYGGTTSWWHYWGTWVMHKGGTYSVTVTLDADNAIAESNESDNTVTINFSVSGSIAAEWELVNAEYGRENLGDGTDVIVGTMDDAFDFLHPWYTGNDSNGDPRLVASNQNALGQGGSPINANHATSVMGIVLAQGLNDGDITGLAPDARYVTAEFINRADEPGLSVLHVLDAAGFLVENDVDVINMCWSWWFGSDNQSMSGETSVTNLMSDYLSYGLNIVCVAAVNQLNGFNKPTAPGSSRNVITVGGLDDGLEHAWGPQDHGPTLDGRCKPDLLGNDAANAVSASANWRDGFPAGEGYFGTSFSAPFVTGAVAQMLDYGKHNGESTDHRVIKAIVMNSGIKARDADGDRWANTPVQPLDDEQGTGILDMIGVHAMYTAGEQNPLTAAVPGYDFAKITNTVDDGPMQGRVIYHFGRLQSRSSRLDITIVWDRHTFWEDFNSDGLIDTSDSFFTSPDDCQDNLDIVLYRDGIEIGTSRSTVDNVEHISLRGKIRPGEYELHIERLPVANSGNSENYAIAWYSDGTWSNLPPSKSPEMYIEQEGIYISNDTGFYDFNRVTVGSSKSVTFIIENLGNTALDLTGSPCIEVSGANADEFVVSKQPLTPVMPGESATFEITFTPTEGSNHSAIVSIVNNDPTVNPYTFSLTGTGVVPLTIYVDADANGQNNGSSWTNAYNYLQDALDVFAEGSSGSDKILVAEGIYKPDYGANVTPGDRTATFQLINGVAVKGGYAGFGEPDLDAQDIDKYKTILCGDLNGDDGPNFANNGENSYHVVIGSGTNETAVLDGFVITGGNANGSYPHYYGGGMYNRDGSGPTIINCTFYKNYAKSRGGGMRNYKNNPILTNCKFIKNTAGYYGGGISHFSNHSMLTNCEFISNSSGTRGGGIYNWNYSRAKLINCTFINNTSRDGGGMHNKYSSCQPTLINCIFSGNSANNGGGIYNGSSSSSTLINCTLSSNLAASNGGGISGGNLVLTNCILWENNDSGGTDESAQIYSGTPEVSFCCIQGWTGDLGGTDNHGDDPLFVERGYWDSNGTPSDPYDDFWVDGDYHLLDNSPCIDTGDPNYILDPNYPTDLDGNPRITEDRIDMGAYEFIGPFDLLIQLAESIDSMGLHGGTANSLLAKLDTAIEKLEDTNEKNDIVAVNTLQAFINAVEAQCGKKIPESDADALIAAAQQIIELLSS